MDRRPAQSLTDQLFDLLVVGGGVNGAGIARDAAGRGLSVALCEQDDFAAHTSSASTKLIHGGLRYLEHFELRLVRKALQEREVLIDSAPHIMWPLRFVMPYAPHLRPEWMIRIGLFLYDHLARRRRLPGSRRIDLRRHAAGKPLQHDYRTGFVYSDGWVDDARLVVLNVKDAAERGAAIFARHRCTELTRGAAQWQAVLTDSGGRQQRLRARAVVNATGPWVGEFLRGTAQLQSSSHLRLVKGSHIVVRRLFAHSYAYIFQGKDQRIAFAIPYEQDFTLIGTTDVEFVGDPTSVQITDDETDYLCRMVGDYFTQQISRSDVIWSYAGVRPLLDDESGNASSVTRDYRLDLNDDAAPLLSVFGGKLTTYRRLAEDALAKLAVPLGNDARPWTAQATLPGGDLPQGDFPRFLRNLRTRHPWLPRSLRQRYAHAYGSRIRTLLGPAARLEDLGIEVLPGLFEAEINYLRREEWAVTAADILWRRSKLGLHLPVGSERLLEQWLSAHPLPAPKDPA